MMMADHASAVCRSGYYQLRQLRCVISYNAGSAAVMWRIIYAATDDVKSRAVYDVTTTANEINIPGKLLRKPLPQIAPI